MAEDVFVLFLGCYSAKTRIPIKVAKHKKDKEQRWS